MGLIRRWFEKKETDVLEPKTLPVHIAVILDGNRRWAKRRGMPKSVGHREGSLNLIKVSKICSRIGIKYLTVYAFSTENWTRQQEEVDSLMTLLLEFLQTKDRELNENNIKLHVIGDVLRLSAELKKEISRVLSMTCQNTGLNLVIALSYGSRDEIIKAVRNIASEVQAGKMDPSHIDESILNQKLYTANIPDPDLLIRPGGEKRISNFLLWQSAYAEFYFTDVLWPDFDEAELRKALLEYQRRHRRFGGA